MTIPFWIIKLILVAFAVYVTFVGYITLLMSGFSGKNIYIYIGIPVMLVGVSMFFYGVLS